MNVTQLTEGLKQAFFIEQHRIVFWYDAEQSFQDDVLALDLPEVNVVNMANESALKMKLQLELEDTLGKYLLYFPHAEPEWQRDWFLDIKLYSRRFYADRFSIILNDLGLNRLSMKEHLSKREEFFKSKSRLNALRRHVQADMGEQQLDMAMIAVVVKSDSADLLHIVQALAAGFESENVSLAINPSAIQEMKKFGLIPTWLNELKTQLGYVVLPTDTNVDTDFNLGMFWIRLLVTGLCENLSHAPDWANDLLLVHGQTRASVRTLLARWQDSSKYYRQFDYVSEVVANELDLSEKLKSLNLENLLEVMLFEVVERHIIKELVYEIPKSAQQMPIFKQVVGKRLDGYWTLKDKDCRVREKYRVIYAALQAAIELLELKSKYQKGFDFVSCAGFYQAYTEELYQFDMAYRHYSHAAQQVNFEPLNEMDQQVEQMYSAWYLDQVARTWGALLEKEQRLQNWRIPQISNQYQFYRSHIRPLVSDVNKGCTVVIISDAFRYEAAKELSQRINHRSVSEAVLTSQLGVVPSYTTLGMAALLPHDTLDYKQGSDDVLVNGLSSQGIEARSKILNQYSGMAVKADEVMEWSRDYGRQVFKNHRLIYVYHNVVDAKGDNAATESETFMAVEQAIQELAYLSHKIVANLNASTLLITADHGFLFQKKKLEDADRSALSGKAPRAIKSKKRYVIGYDLPDEPYAWKGSTKETAGVISEVDFWIPKGNNRFHFVAGSRFVHGGAMPQEIVVPVLTVKKLRGEKLEKHAIQKVKVISRQPTWKMVNNIHKFELFQTEPIKDNLVPVTVTVAVYDGMNVISNEATVTFDFSTEAEDTRVKYVTISLAGSQFDRKKDYFLVIKDKESGIEINRYKVTIDLLAFDEFFE